MRIILLILICFFLSGCFIGCNEQSSELEISSSIEKNCPYLLADIEKEIDLGDSLKGTQLLDSLIMCSPKNYDALFIRGSLRLKSSQYSRALQDLVKSRKGMKEGDFHFTDLLSAMSQSYAGLGDSAIAISYMDSACDLEPNSTAKFFWNSNMYELLGDFQIAISYMDSALGLDSAFIPAINYRGILKLKQGDTIGACEDFSQVFATKPDWTDETNRTICDLDEAFVIIEGDSID